MMGERMEEGKRSRPEYRAVPLLYIDSSPRSRQIQTFWSNRAICSAQAIGQAAGPYFRPPAEPALARSLRPTPPPQIRYARTTDRIQCKERLYYSMTGLNGCLSVLQLMSLGYSRIWPLLSRPTFVFWTVSWKSKLTPVTNQRCVEMAIMPYPQPLRPRFGGSLTLQTCLLTYLLTVVFKIV